MESVPLVVRDLTKSFFPGSNIVDRLRRRSAKQAVIAVSSVSFEVGRGEIFGIIGANGSGKSTLVRIVSTLLLPDSGSVAVFGIDAVHEPGRVRHFINRVSADPAFFKNMSTFENLLFFGRIYGMSRAQIREAMPPIFERLGLEPEKASEPMSRLSRGQQQKVAVARAFLTSPVLMLLDEPTTGLDPRSKREVQSFIQEVVREHDATILLTTHDMDEAESLCTRIAFLSRGAVVAEGSPPELRQRVAAATQLESVTMETVFMQLTGQSIAEDEVQEETTSV
jgi:ABC-2 type transport system ATP-binding protein